MCCPGCGSPKVAILDSGCMGGGGSIITCAACDSVFEEESAGLLSLVFALFCPWSKVEWRRIGTRTECGVRAKIL
jgi:hypothetical protein